MLHNASATDLVRSCWFLTGATAAGKTRVGLELAQRLSAEIISLDSMAIYRGMDVGTAKPTAEDRRRVPHHLLDLVDPTEEFSVSQYVALAHEKIREIRQRGREVLFVGGTPLYLKALLRGLFEGPAADWDFRKQVEDEARAVGALALHARLAQVDPLSAAKLHPHDLRRIIRALEVQKLTGQPISHLQLQFDEGRPAEECRVFVLDWPRAELHRRVNERVDRMFAEGLVAETQALLDTYGSLGRTASQAVGYFEVIEHLAGRKSLAETVELAKARTRRFVRRQETWFRSLSECRRVPQSAGKSATETADELARL
jgi:tRNA dimethylallyltransferase